MKPNLLSKTAQHKTLWGRRTITVRCSHGCGTMRVAMPSCIPASAIDDFRAKVYEIHVEMEHPGARR